MLHFYHLFGALQNLNSTHPTKGSNNAIMINDFEIVFFMLLHEFLRVVSTTKKHRQFFEYHI